MKKIKDEVDYGAGWVRPEFPATGLKGHWRTEALFLDTAPEPEKVAPSYTFREHAIEYDGKVLPSAYQVILHSDSEYDAAIRLLGSYRHWERLKKSPRVFNKGVYGKQNVYTIEIALRDMHIRIQAEAKSELLALAQTGNVTAARTIYDGAPIGKEKSKPKKETKGPGTSPTDSILASIDKFGKK